MKTLQRKLHQFTYGFIDFYYNAWGWYYLMRDRDLEWLKEYNITPLEFRRCIFFDDISTNISDEEFDIMYYD